MCKNEEDEASEAKNKEVGFSKEKQIKWGFGSTGPFIKEDFQEKREREK